MQSVVQKKSYGSVTVFWLDRQAAVAAVRAAARKWADEDARLLKVVLFGSLATGTATAASDVDVMAVVSGSGQPLLRRAGEYEWRFSGIGLSVDMFVYTDEEIRSQPSSIAEHALHSGLTVFDRQPKSM